MVSSVAQGRLRQGLAALLLLGIVGWALSLASFARLEEADFTFNNGQEVQSLDPAMVTGVPEGRVVRAIFEGLVVKDEETLEPLPGMAESWEVSPDGLTYTFHIREGAVWSNGDRFTAHDFVFSFERFLHPETGADYAYQLWYVEGAKAFTTETVGKPPRPIHAFDTVAIHAPDDFTLVLRLNSPCAYFMHLMGFYPLFPVNRRNLEEAQAAFPTTWRLEWMKPERIVTNGPFRIDYRRVNDRIRLVKNEKYWDADNVAFDTIDVLTIVHVGTSLNAYLTGGHSWLDNPPANLVPRLLPREDFQPRPYMGTYFYRVNVLRSPFDDKRIRKALSLTIDRKAICEKITKAGQVPAYALVPPVLHDYVNAETARENTEEAQRLLAEAGYGPGQKPLPTIEILYNTLETHRDIAEVIAVAWRRELGLNVKLLNQEWKVYLASQAQHQYDVCRAAWIGDYPDPNTFLDMFVTGGENNRTGWGNPEYDRLIAAAAGELDPVRRMQMLHDAEAILMDELPILPIYYYVTQNVIDPRLGGFKQNALNEHFPKFWYWMDDAELEERRKGWPDQQRIERPTRFHAGLYSPAQRAARERAR